MGRWKKATPGEGGEVRAEQFAYTSTQAGLKNTWNAWCAHEPYWCKAHEHTDKFPGTKVCTAWFTDGAVPCPRCRPAVVPTVIAYVPVWREVDLKPCLVIIHEGQSDNAVSLKFGTFVLIGRVGAGDGVFVKPSETQRPWRSDLPCRQSPCDLNATLLTIWGYPALEQWLRTPVARRSEGSQPADSPARHRLSVPPPTSTVEALAIDAEKKTPATWDELQSSILSRVKKQGSNGKHGGPPATD